MKKFFVLLFIFVNIEAATIVELAGDKNYPPYSYEENAKAKGVYVDILKLAFSKLPDYDVKFNMMAWKRAIVLVKKGSSIGFFPPYYSDERTSWTKFSEPILSETTRVFAKDDILKDKQKYPEDFFGLSVCLNRGFSTLTVGGVKFDKAVKEKKITLVEGNDNKACLNRVSKGLVDFYINDQLIDISSFTNIKKGLIAKENFGHVGFTLKTKKYPYMDDLTLKLNKVIKDMKKSGEIDKILRNYK